MKIPKQKVRIGMKPLLGPNKGVIDFPITAPVLVDDIEQVIVKRIIPNMSTGYLPYSYSITPYEENYRSLRS